MYDIAKRDLIAMELPLTRNISLLQNSLAVLTKKEQKLFVWFSPFFPSILPWTAGWDTQKSLFLSSGESLLSVYFWCILLPCEDEGFEIIRETAGVGVVTGTHQLCSSVIPRTTLRRDLSKGSAEQIRFAAALHVFVASPGSSLKESVLSFRLC